MGLKWPRRCSPCPLSMRGVITAMLECPRYPAPQEERIDAGVGDAAPYPERSIETWSHVADFHQFFPDPALFQRFLVTFHVGDCFSDCFPFHILQHVERAFSRNYSALHSGVRSFDLRDVQGTSCTSEEGTTREVQLR